jgi:hypothetical protein
MVERYAIVDPKVRDFFEKKYQIPYGYGMFKIFTDREEAITSFKKIPKELRDKMKVERITDDAREYLRI